LAPLRTGGPFSYCPFDCQTGGFREEIQIAPKPLNVIEGVYSLHLTLIDAYHIKVFLAVEPEEQMRRIILRDGAEMWARFRDTWIPKETSYFLHFDVKNHCDFIGKHDIIEEQSLLR